MEREPDAEEINDRAKLLAHRLVARRLAHDPGMVERVRQVLARLRADGRRNTFIDEWERLLELGPDRLRRIIAERSETMDRLRVSSPLGLASGMFRDEALRRRIRRKAKHGLTLRMARGDGFALPPRRYPGSLPLPADDQC